MHGMNAGTVHTPTDAKAAISAGLAPPEEPTWKRAFDDASDEVGWVGDDNLLRLGGWVF